MDRKFALRCALVVPGLALAAVLAVHLIYWIVLLTLWGMVFWPLWWAVLIVICVPLSAIFLIVGLVILLRFSTDWCLDAVESD